MSWIFSKAMVEAYGNLPSSQGRAVESWAGSCSDGEPCAPLNLMPTAHPFLRRGKTTDASNLSRSGQTCSTLTESRGKELLKSFLAASHAQTSAQQEREPGSMETQADSGGTWPASWVRFDPHSYSWKTPQCSLLADSEPYSGTWPRSGSMHVGMCSEHASLGSLMLATECGSSLPTPSAVNGGKNNTMGRIDEWGGSSNPLRGTVIGSMCLPEFEEMVMGWPLGWTEPTPYETGRFHAWLQQHGIYSVNKEAA